MDRRIFQEFLGKNLYLIVYTHTRTRFLSVIIVRYEVHWHLERRISRSQSVARSHVRKRDLNPEITISCLVSVVPGEWEKVNGDARHADENISRSSVRSYTNGGGGGRILGRKKRVESIHSLRSSLRGTSRVYPRDRR